MSNQETTAAATDVGEFITDLDGGMFDRKLSIALSQVASATVDHDNAGRWYMLDNNGMATLCASEADALSEAAAAKAETAAAVAAERGKCAGIVNELRMECARRNMPESATMLWHAEDAIRAGAKEPSNG